VSTNGRLALLQQDGLVGLETRADKMAVMPTIHCVDALVVGLCRILEQCAGPSAMPARVVFMRPRMAPAEAYREILGCPVDFDGPHIAIWFDAAAAAQPVLSGNAELAAEADKLSARYIDELAPDSTAARVRALLLKAMPSGEFGRDAIARSLNQSASTLQRRLRDEGATYQELLDATRHEMALEYLRQGGHSLVDVAFLLGFTDQSNFTRAFRRWTGKTPREYLS
jgi:AraC-like DNA-binding protein